MKFQVSVVWRHYRLHLACFDSFKCFMVLIHIMTYRPMEACIMMHTLMDRRVDG